MKLRKNFNGFRRIAGIRLRHVAAILVLHPIRTYQKMKRIAAVKLDRVESVTRTIEFTERTNGVRRFHYTVSDVIEQIGEIVGVLVLSESRNRAHIGVSDENYFAVVQHLLRTLPDVQLIIDEKLINTLKVSGIDLIMESKYVRILFHDRIGVRSEICLDQYAPTFDGQWLSRNDHNAVMRRCCTAVFDTPNITRAQTLLGGDVLGKRLDDDPIDAVLTWVDHTDEDWQRSYTAALKNSGASNTDATSFSRFRNNDELRFALRSLHSYAPWIRRIYVFTNCQPPQWFDQASDKVMFIPHSQVMPDNVLPTFNSHVIESYIHKIPGLSERFIYLNDDFFLMNATTPSDFFSATGMSLAHLETYGMVSGSYSADSPDYLNAARKAARLIHKELGFVPTQLHKHVPYSLFRSVLLEMEEKWSTEYSAFRSNKFRAANDLNIPSFMYHHYALGTGRAEVRSSVSVLVKSNDETTQNSRLQRAADPNTVFVCINEGGVEETTSDWKNRIRRFLVANFPNRAPWEV